MTIQEREKHKFWKNACHKCGKPCSPFFTYCIDCEYRNGGKISTEEHVIDLVEIFNREARKYPVYPRFRKL